ncbi:MAG: aldo/keto reductase, partial [Ilumatobacteraceae bacterium]
MEYRRLGSSGLRVSVLSFGSWVTFDNQLKDDTALACMQAAWDAGCNFFDNAEAYAGGESEAIMGRVISQLGWKRHHYVLSTKVFWGIDGPIPNMQNSLNRKYLHHSIEGCLDRLQVDFVDLLFCHRADPKTPIEETVWAMSDLVDRGKVLYWGTSEWSADEIRAAWEIAERHHLHKPVMEQPQYNMLHRDRVEREYAPLYEEIGLRAEHVRIVARTRDWLRYDVPEQWMRRELRGNYRGQKQIWFLLKMLGEDHHIELRSGSEKPEFDAWCWHDFFVPLDSVIEFKRNVYWMAMSELASYLFS